MNRVFDLAFVVIIGAMVANLVLHPEGTKTIVNGLTSIWGQSIKAVNPSAG
jgi:hypothetical protein